MNQRNSQNQKWNFPRMIYVIFLFLIVVLGVQLCYLALSPNIYGINMEEFSSSRNTVKKTLYATRGNIFDLNGNILAQNVNSYTVIAYLDESRTGSSKTPLHVVDKHKTAEALSPILDMDVEYIESLLNKDVYQVELGPGGRGITELKKDEIESLGLPGISFIENYKRYYPNGDFASYIVGYAKQYDEEITDENGQTIIESNTVGELGIEAKYDEYLKGTNGYLEYQKDLQGFKIPDTKETRIEASDGYDIYLTIDSGIQRFVEEAISESYKTYNPEWLMVGVMDAKTGDLLATATRPSFDPNVKEIINYENLLISELHEPGSTMKTYTYMCAMEKGTYDGSATYNSGSIKIGEDVVNDWNKKGWGTITYDKGYEYSSNVGISYMLQNFINKNDLRKCLEKYGFGSLTNIELDRELKGNIDFKYDIEIANAGFGQGITTTALQQMQGLTIISNNGKKLTPHIVDKIVNPNNGEIIYESKKEESEKLVSDETIKKIKDLMYNVVHGTDAGTTGMAYNIEDFDVIAKTGTAQIYDNKNNRYFTGIYDYVYSFAGMFPKDDPAYIIYVGMKIPKSGGSMGISTVATSLMKSIAKYKNMFSEQITTSDINEYKIESYYNKNINDIKNKLNSNNINVTVIGNGDKIINQYPLVGTSILSNDRVILVTNDKNVTMPNIIGWSKKNAIQLFKMLGLNYNVEGYGYVKQSSIKEGTTINIGDEISIILEEKIKVE